MTMIFIAQINNEEIDKNGEGVYYSFVCPTCRVTATSYQQT